MAQVEWGIKQNAVVPTRMVASSMSTNPSPGCSLARKPTKKMAINGSCGEPPVSSPDEWVKTHPSALDMFEEILKASQGKRIAMFLDYDGTLSPIVENPDQAFMSESMRAVLRDIARYFPTAIVSGRCRDKVSSFVRLAELYYAGSHGMDIKGPSRDSTYTQRSARPVMYQPASEFLPIIDEVFKILQQKTSAVDGSIVENNKFCLSVHYRCVDEKSWTGLAEEVRAVVKDYPMLKLTEGRKVLEIRPTIEWDKGKALEFLLESLGFADCNDVFPVYIGDDRTDEDAFRVLRDREQGLGILVSKIPKETSASYCLEEPAEVGDFLNRLVDWKKRRGLHAAAAAVKGTRNMDLCSSF